MRDACRLPVAAAPGIPPPLAGDVPDRSDLLAPSEHADAAARWVRWWEAIVAHEGASELGVLVLPPDPMTRLATLASLAERLLDWPELEVLADEPALQRAVRALHDEGSRWCAEQARSARTAGGPGGSPIPHGLARAVAEEVIERTGVGPGKVRAGVLVLGVEGHFAHLASPGVLFVGLVLEVAFADGRSARVDELAGLDVDGEVILSRFWREGSEDELWLWVSPRPPAGPVTVRADWSAYGLRAATVSFEGALLRGL